LKVHTIDLNFQGRPQSIAAYLIQEGTNLAIVETGPHSTLPELLNGIRNIGFQPEDIKQVFLTHVHLDHAGAAWYFANLGATIYVHPAGAKHLIEPSRLYNSAKMIYKDQMETLWGEMNPIAPELVQSVQNEIQIPFADSHLIAWHTPGHAIHHIAWQWGQNLFAGDVAGVKIGTGPVVPPCPPPDINIEDWINSLNILRVLKISRIYLAHFGEVNKIRRHLNALEKKLVKWSNWMEPYYINQMPQSEITPLFTQFTKNELQQKEEVSDELLETYENANPSWMGVAGLMRYWHKKSQTE